MKLEQLFDDKLGKIFIWGAMWLNIFMGTVSGLSNKPVNEMGILSFILAALCIGAVVISSKYLPFFGPLLAVIIIYVPGAIMGALVKVIIIYGVVAVIASPVMMFWYIITTAFPFFFPI